MESVERLCVCRPTKSMSRFSLVVVTFLVLALSTASRAAGAADSGTDAYEKLKTYGFPEGLLPHIVSGYTLGADGEFTLFLESKCRVLIQEQYPLLYDKVITGTLSYGQLQGLKGITVKAYYIWWNITGISLRADDENSLFFEIGILSTKFPFQNFDDPPICESHSLQSSFMDSRADQ